MKSMKIFNIYKFEFLYLGMAVFLQGILFGSLVY